MLARRDRHRRRHLEGGHDGEARPRRLGPEDRELPVRFQKGVAHFAQILDPVHPQQRMQLGHADPAGGDAFGQHPPVAHHRHRLAVHGQLHRTEAPDERVEQLVDPHDRRHHQHGMKERHLG